MVEQMKKIRWDVLPLLLLLAIICIPIVTALSPQPTEGACMTATDALSPEKEYDPEEYTLVRMVAPDLNTADKAPDQGLDPMALENESRALLKKFTQEFGETLPPGYLGMAGVTPPEDAKVGAYIFRVLPTGETIQYTGLCGKACLDYSDLLTRAEEWKESELIAETNELTGTESNPSPIASVTLECSYDRQEYGEDYGCAKIKSTYFWDNVETDRYNDYFYVKTYAQTDPGVNCFQGSVFRNHIFEISHDWVHNGYPGCEHLPYADITDYSPGQTPGYTTVTACLSSSTGGLGTSMSWSTEVPDYRVEDDSHHSLDLAKWDEVFNYDAACSQRQFVFRPGSTATCFQSTARDGSIYTICRVEMDCHRGWLYDGLLFDKMGPSDAGPLAYNLYAHWEDGWTT